MLLNMRHIIPVLVLALFAAACTKQDSAPHPPPRQLTVVTTLFPLYDFARTVGGERVRVSLLLPPGVEAHSFQPRPDDALRIRAADVFVYTNQYMEPWAIKFARSAGGNQLLLVDSGAGVTFLKGGRPEQHDEHDGHGHGAGMDPHIWLDFANAQIMVRSIEAALAAKDPANSAYYAANATALVDRLKALDLRFTETLSSCRHRTFLHGGHYAFGYLARRYGLTYASAAAVNADAEPTPSTLVALVKRVKMEGLKYIFSEELLSPRISEMIARETGISVLMLHGAHNISTEDFTRGTTFLELMSRNLENLRIGLQCSEQSSQQR